jgi:hypothetical protein
MLAGSATHRRLILTAIPTPNTVVWESQPTTLAPLLDPIRTVPRVPNFPADLPTRAITTMTTFRLEWPHHFTHSSLKLKASVASQAIRRRSGLLWVHATVNCQITRLLLPRIPPCLPSSPRNKPTFVAPAVERRWETPASMYITYVPASSTLGRQLIMTMTIADCVLFKLALGFKPQLMTDQSPLSMKIISHHDTSVHKSQKNETTRFR